MSAVWRRAEAWLFPAASPARVAVLRVLVGVFSTGYLAIRLPAFLALAGGDPSAFDGVGVLGWRDSPMAGAIVVGAVVITLALGVAYTAGAAFRVVGPAFAVGLLMITTYRSSWGQLLNFENLMVLHVLILGCSRSADTLSIDARRRPRQAASDAAYGSPVRLAALVTVITYVLAGLAKLRLGGLAWITGDTLRNHVAYSAARLELLGGSPSPLARPLVAHGAIFPPMAVAAVVVELGAPLAFVTRLRTAWVAAAWAMHAGIAALMFIVFPYPLMLVAFAPFYELERITGWWRSMPRRRVGRRAVRARLSVDER